RTVSIDAREVRARLSVHVVEVATDDDLAILLRGDGVNRAVHAHSGSVGRSRGRTDDHLGLLLEAFLLGKIRRTDFVVLAGLLLKPFLAGEVRRAFVIGGTAFESLFLREIRRACLVVLSGGIPEAALLREIGCALVIGTFS